MYINHIADFLSKCRFDDSASLYRAEMKLKQLLETARQDGELNGLWMAALRAEEVEAKRGCKSMIAQQIMRYRTSMQLRLERECGFNVKQEA